MQAAIIDEFGEIDSIRIRDVAKPEPGADEVQIEMAYAGINPVDWKICEGHIRGLLPNELPIVLGWDGAGTVSAVGEHVTQLKVGDKVYAFFRKPVIQWGTFCQYACFSAEHVVKAPSNLTLAQASTIPLAALTAWQALTEFAGLQAGQTVLVHAGAGGVGSFALQFAKHLGAKVYTTASSAKRAYVEKLGADIVIDYTKESFVERINSEEPGGLDVVFDCVGGQTLEDSFQVVKEEGKLPSIVNKPDQSLAEARRIKTDFVFVRPDGEQLAEISRLIEQGKVVPPDVEVFPFEKVSEALAKNKAGHTQGKITLQIKPQV